MSSHSFTHCPRCGQETARAVEVCIRCGHTAGGRPTAGGSSAFAFLVLSIIVGSLGFAAWWFLFARPSPIVGSWTKGKLNFTFERDGDLHSNGMFQKNGTFVIGTRRITSHWKSAGNRLTITPEGKNAEGRDVEWEINGQKLTLKGVDHIGTIRSTVGLTRDSAAPRSP